MPLRAQEPQLPSNSPTPAATGAPAETPTPPPIIPAAPVAPVLPPAPDVPDISQLDAAFQQTPLGKAADDYRMHVEWRKLQNRVATDPELLELWKSANHARTDLEKRKRLRAYYRRYYAKLEALADTPELKAYLAAQRDGHLAITAQNNVRPSATPGANPTTTVPPSITPTPEPTASLFPIP